MRSSGFSGSRVHQFKRKPGSTSPGAPEPSWRFYVRSVLHHPPRRRKPQESTRHYRGSSRRGAAIGRSVSRIKVGENPRSTGNNRSYDNPFPRPENSSSAAGQVQEAVERRSRLYARLKLVRGLMQFPQPPDSNPITWAEYHAECLRVMEDTSRDWRQRNVGVTARHVKIKSGNTHLRADPSKRIPGRKPT